MQEIEAATRMTQMEELLAHQQRLLDDLNEVITQQRAELDKLHRDYRTLADSMRTVVENLEVGDPLPHEKPPHY